MRLLSMTNNHIPAAVKLQKMAITDLCEPDYGKNICAQWVNDIEESDFAGFKEGQYFVAEDAGEIIAMGGWTGDNLKLFYIAPNLVGQGLATEFYEALEKLYLTEKPKHWLVLATLTALPFYLKMGFQKMQTSVFKLKNGIELPMHVLMKTYSPEAQ